MHFNGIPLRTVSFALRNDALLAMVRPGQSLQAAVRAEGNQLFLQLGAHRIALEGDVPVNAGQMVQVQVRQTDEGMQLLLTPQSVTAGATPVPGASGALESVLNQVLDLFGAGGFRELAPRFVAPELPPAPEILRQLFTVILNRSDFGQSLQELLVLLEEASAADVLPENFPAALGQLLLTGEEDTAEILRLLQTLSKGQNPEARAAAALRAGNPQLARQLLEQDLRVQLEGLRGRDALIAWMRGKGRLQRFEKSIQKALDHLSGSRVANTRGMDQPYHFLEIPFAPEAGLRNGQIHFFEEGRGGGGKRGGFSAAAIDIETSRLGQMWITIQAAGGVCQCHFRVMDAGIAGALKEAAHELEGALKNAGYHDAVVRASLWDGNRLREAAALMQRFSGINVNA